MSLELCNPKYQGGKGAGIVNIIGHGNTSTYTGTYMELKILCQARLSEYGMDISEWLLINWKLQAVFQVDSHWPIFMMLCQHWSSRLCNLYDIRYQAPPLFSRVHWIRWGAWGRGYAIKSVRNKRGKRISNTPYTKHWIMRRVMCLECQSLLYVHVPPRILVLYYNVFGNGRQIVRWEWLSAHGT